MLHTKFYIKIAFVPILWVLCIFYGSTQIGTIINLDQEYIIDQVSISDGLVSNYVTKTVSDSNNLKYFATEGGISRYNGYSFKTFRPGNSYPDLLNENIETLFKDKDNHIWIGTKSGGLSMLDVNQNKITDYNSIFDLNGKSPYRVISLNQDKRGHIWVGTWSNGIFVIDPVKNKIIEHFTYQSPILKIINDQNDDIWFIVDNILGKASYPDYKLKETALPYYVTTLVEDISREKIWVVGNNGLDVLLLSSDINNGEIIKYNTALKAKYIRSIAVDAKKRLWLGSWGDGLYISDPEVSRFSYVNTNPDGSKNKNINNSIILDIEIDKNEIAWLGTAHGGVLKLYPNKGFVNLKNSSYPDVFDQNVLAIYKGYDNQVFVGTISVGLLKKTSDTEFGTIPGFPKQRVKTIKEIGKNLYVGTNEGLLIIKDRDFNNPIVKFPKEKITAIHLDKNNRLWLGTLETGLKVTNFLTDTNLDSMRVYSENQQGTYQIENNRINKIVEDSEGRIWLATYSGLNLYENKSQRFIRHHELTNTKFPSVIINDLYLKNKTIFAATPGGLIQMTQSNGKGNVEAIYTSENGLLNDFVCALEEDKNQNIWFSTINGLTSFNPSQKTFLHYDRRNGFKIQSFHIGSSYRDNEGNLYFGGNTGMVMFNPEKLTNHLNTATIVFTDLIVNNTVINVNDLLENRKILEQDINSTQKIKLKYNQNHFTLLFTTNDFRSKDNVMYQYRLLGNQKNWLNVRNKNEISLSGLKPGNYTLEIRAGMDMQNWGETKSIKIEIGSPPWASWYAYILYAFLTLGFVFLINFVSSRQAKLEAKLTIAQIEKEKEHELNESKITFFTNISHEFRTPLTLILSPVTELLSEVNLSTDVKNKLTLIDNNARRLLNLINQLLDFRKSEYGLLQLNAEKSDFISFAKEIYLLFQDVSKQKSITYKFETEIDHVVLPFDRDKMEIVLCNILSNAFKFSKQGGVVLFYLYINDGYLNIEIQDNGIGLAEAEADRVFDKFYQVQNPDSAKITGSGIGLAFTKSIVDLHHGNIFVNSGAQKETIFTIRLLLKNDYLSVKNPFKEESITYDESHELKQELDNNWQIQQLPEPKEDKQKELILIIDDNEDIRKYLNDLLKNDFRICEADNGLSGLQLAKSELPDIIISDIMMPEMDGIELCKEIKSQIATSHIPVILLTARASDVYELHGLETGADDYVTKPFNPLIMKSRINNILENHRKLRNYFLNKVRFEPEIKETKLASNLDEKFVEEAIKMVSDNITNEDFNLDVLLKNFYMSRSTLYRKIKSLTGLSITGFVRSVRLKKAAQMILNDNVKLSEVAYEVGFNDYKYFRLSFQQQFGCLPSDYRDKMKSS
jgi:signal transduction histidine kinase/ligand-binding sensor domain-containing protein/DNA-binding response OmpR family regulator